MNSEQKDKPQSERFSKVGRHVDETVNRAKGKLDEECERLVSYLNEEVVPAVRQHSSRGLRKAAEKLAQFADYLESSRQA
jgi:hypothetical protein